MSPLPPTHPPMAGGADGRLRRLRLPPASCGREAQGVARGLVKPMPLRTPVTMLSEADAHSRGDVRRTFAGGE